MKGEQFVKLPRDMLESAEWQTLSINGRRLLDFLMIEHMRHAGKRNGFLLAPRDQLAAFGIGRHFISAAIAEVERSGLVDVRRGSGRRPSMYGLTWETSSDGSAATNRWRSYAVAGAKQHPQAAHEIGAIQHPQEIGAVSSKNRCQTAPTKPVAGAKQHPQGPDLRGAKQHHPSRLSYQAGDISKEEGRKGTAVGAGVGSEGGRYAEPISFISGKLNGTAVH